MKELEMPLDNCPTAAAPKVTVYTRVLHRACQIAGSVERLAVRLRVPSVSLLRWLEADGEPPIPVFLKAVDIVLSAESSRSEAPQAARPD